MKKRDENIVFGGGCFWCTEAIFSELRGVVSVVPGYAGGHKISPSYEDICTGSTGHAEVVKVEYDPGMISLGDLLKVFFALHDPTTKNRQGNDVGDQYRSVIFYMSAEQKKQTDDFIDALKASREFKSPIVTEVKPFSNFYEAEDYHKNYYALNSEKPYCRVIISPKLLKLREKFKKFLK